MIINDVAFEVPSGPLNVKEVFGEVAVLVHSSGQPVVTNEWGVTLHPLQHGAFYYLVLSLNFVHLKIFRIQFSGVVLLEML